MSAAPTPTGVAAAGTAPRPRHPEHEAGDPPSSAAAQPVDLASRTCGGEPVVLDQAVLRSWEQDAAGTIVLSVLVPSVQRGFRNVRLRYAGARVVDRTGGPLDALPLPAGRRYVLRGEDRRHREDGCHHTLRFFPAPEFTIICSELSAES